MGRRTTHGPDGLQHETDDERGEDELDACAVAARPELDRGASAACIRALTEAALFGDAPCSHIGPYRVLRGLGHGAMGVVYLAHDLQLDRTVALKLVREAGSDVSFRRRLIREAKMLARVNHPNIVSIHTALVENDEVYVVMEYVEGEPLARWMAKDRHGWREVVERFVQAGRGLVAAHQAGVVHRDFKPDNVVVGRDGRVRVVDFGLARTDPWLEDAPTEPDLAASFKGHPITCEPGKSTFGTAGTPAYMAPEQHAGVQADAQTDQYAFCVSLYEALTGSTPFKGHDASTLFRAKNRCELRRPQRVPRRLWKILRRGLSPRRSERHPNMAALVASLEGVLSPSRRRSAWVAAGSGFAVAGLVLAVGRSHSAPRCPQEPRESLASVYDAQARTRLHHAFVETGVPFAAIAADATLDRLDAYADRWLEVRASACSLEDTPVRAARLECTERALQSLDRLLSLQSEATPDGVAHAVGLTYWLSPLDTCEPLTRDDPEALFGSQAIALGALEARAIASAGDSSRALQHLDALGDREGLTPFDRAYLTLTRGELLSSADRFEAAAEVLDRAWVLSEEADADELVSRAILARATVANDQGFFIEGAKLVDVAAARIRGHRDSVEIEARVEYEKASIALNQGKYEQAKEGALAALELSERAWGPRIAHTVRARLLVAETLAIAGEGEHAIELLHDALSEQQRERGDRHPTTLAIRIQLGELLRREGRTLEALPHALEARSAVGEVEGGTHRLAVQAHFLVAGLQIMRGQALDALRSVRRHRETTRALTGDEHPAMLDAALAEAYTLNHLGRPAAALEVLEQARTLANELPSVSATVGALIDDTRAASLMLLGRDDEAMELVGPSLERLVEATPNEPWTAQAAYKVARLAARMGRRDEARRHLHLARAIRERATSVPAVHAGLKLSEALVLEELDEQHDEAWQLHADVASEVFANTANAPLESVRLGLRMTRALARRGDRAGALLIALATHSIAQRHGLESVELAKVHAWLSELLGPETSMGRHHGRRAMLHLRRIDAEPEIAQNVLAEAARNRFRNARSSP